MRMILIVLAVAFVGCVRIDIKCTISEVDKGVIGSYDADSWNEAESKCVDLAESFGCVTVCECEEK